MIGLSISNIKKSDICKLYERTEDFHTVNEVLSSESFYVGYSCHNDYPIEIFQIGDYTVIIEGCIYNKTHDDIKRFFEQYIDTNDSTIIENIVSESDGDYIVYIINNVSEKLVIFNDYMGRLPLYYYCVDGRLIISRKINFILSNIRDICIKKESIFEYLMFEYYHGNETLYENVNRMDFHQMLVFRDGNLSVTSTSDDNYDNCIKGSQKSTDIALEYQKSTKIRCDYFINEDFVATLSGGFDSRAVYSCLRKNSLDNIDYVTYDYIQDESIVAQKLLSIDDNNKHFTKLVVNKNQNNNENDLLFKTSGLINCYTNNVCYRDLRSMYDIFPHKKLLIGFGGEFFRHPYYLLFGNPGYYIRMLLSTNLVDIFYKDNPSVASITKKVIGKYQERTRNGILKRLYYDYYKNYVVGAGEERYRLYYWTIQPLMSLEAVKRFLFLKNTSLSDFSFFCNIIKQISPELAKIEIFGDNTDLYNKSHWWIKSFKLKVYPFLLPLQRVFLKITNSTKFKDCEITSGDIEVCFNEEIINKTFDKKQVLKGFGESGILVKRRLYTILKYIIEINNKFDSVMIR